ncbi:hypothetical protein Aab01nite_72170 [Paractinoplanes abujensis]|uniref:Uncharacterized protein n=1 Tax=Paractinoplanes abujensis TaxID=882441 RepID=A0A7W7G260_9ACTN|nr:hypothetical protein [Actinoplanes abujensis]MBB4694898.1 hypothetical protein [Actinoplanes abujensis]GID23627.1 hypothetical protein Aab01nite_72170 [Actinoplanes abujensis]
MKFFSNEKENETQTDPDRTQPVVVPPQRAGSPWSDAPRDGADHGDRGPERRDDADRADVTDRSDLADRADPADRSDRDQEQVTKTTTYGPDGSVVEDTTYKATHTDVPAADRPQDSPVDLPLTDEPAGKSPEDAALKDDGSFDGPKAVDPTTGRSLDDTRDEGARGDDTLKDDGTFDSPQAVDPATGKTLDGEESQPSAEPTPAVAAAAVPATPAKPAAPTGDRLLADGDTFTERFREIQLRFVDEPKAATAEAAELVGEAVDKLTSALKAQRDSLGGNADDTEKLRVELRAYRDIINRLTAL